MKRWLIAALLLIAAAPVAWFWPALQSYAVMGVHSALQNNTSVMRQNGFAVKMAAGEGWYPLILTHNAEGFADWSGIRADMSVLYCFGAFDAATRTSSLYDPESALYSAFYGAYAMKKEDGAFGFSGDGALNMQEVAAAVEYDCTQLVMRGFGCASPVFSIEKSSVRQGVTYAGSGGWTRIDARMRLSGAAHNYQENKTCYLQYGRPTQPADEDFAVIEMDGRIYAKYFGEYGCTVMLYAMAQGRPTVDACDGGVLAGTVIDGA